MSAWHWKAEKRLWNRRPSGVRRKVFYARCRQYLGDADGYFVFMDLAGREEWYDVGMLYDVHQAGKANMTEENIFAGSFESCTGRD